MKILTRIERLWAKRVLALMLPDSSPNLSELAKLAKNARLVELNIKAFGYDLAHKMAAALPVPANTRERHVGLRSKSSTQADIESDWTAHWSAQLKAPVLYHRKLWELTYVLQAIYESGHMRHGARGLGFGCGVEPLPSYLASRGASVTITDLDPVSASTLGWIESNQHSATLEQAYHPHLVSRDDYDRLVSFRIADMVTAHLVG